MVAGTRYGTLPTWLSTGLSSPDSNWPLTQKFLQYALEITGGQSDQIEVRQKTRYRIGLALILDQDFGGKWLLGCSQLGGWTVTGPHRVARVRLGA